MQPKAERAINIIRFALKEILIQALAYLFPFSALGVTVDLQP